MTKVAGDSIYPVLNMLNTKYIILPLQGGQTVPVLNTYCLSVAVMGCGVSRTLFSTNIESLR